MKLYLVNALSCKHHSNYFGRRKVVQSLSKHDALNDHVRMVIFIGHLYRRCLFHGTREALSSSTYPDFADGNASQYVT